MTRYEYLDFVTSSIALISENGFNFISVFFAYVVCAYLVGRTISRAQAVAISAAYTLYLGICVMTVVTTLGRLIVASLDHSAEAVLRFQTMQIAGPSLLGFIWLSSLVYMFTENARRAPPD